MTDQHLNSSKQWYAAKVFFNKTSPLQTALDRDQIRYFIPSQVIPSLLFLYCDADYLRHFQENNRSQLWVYCNRTTHTPSAIADAEMETFIFVVTAGSQGLQYLGDDKPEYHTGDRVRVTAGPFKGAEGHIRRIKKDRRLIVAIRGVAAIATTFIPQHLLEKIPTLS